MFLDLSEMIIIFAFRDWEGQKSSNETDEIGGRNN